MAVLYNFSLFKGTKELSRFIGLTLNSGDKVEMSHWGVYLLYYVDFQTKTHCSSF